MNKHIIEPKSRRDYRRLNILLLNNNFSGSYNSNKFYYKEIEMELTRMGCNVFLVDTIQKAVDIYEKYRIDFSLCLGVYKYEIEGIKLYDYYKIPNYQWISDNPFKMDIDYNSTFIKYIFIDYEFIRMTHEIKNEPLVLPLGCIKKEPHFNFTNKINGVLFPGQVRNIDNIELEINNSRFKMAINQFIADYDMDTSFIDAFTNFADSSGLSLEKEFFRLCNSYIRAYKRIIVLKAIKDIPVYIAGQKQYNGFSGNYNFLGEKSFYEIENLMSNYRYVLNVDPNYYDCIHDRVSRAINVGSVVISNNSKALCSQKGYSNTYSFRDIQDINKLLHYTEREYKDIHMKQLKFIEDSYWDVSLKKIVDDYNRWRIKNEINKN